MARPYDPPDGDSRQPGYCHRPGFCLPARTTYLYAANLDVGIMIEIPSAAVLASQVDFFSIGANDLAPYTLAVDRTNEQVAHLADPLHPAVIRLIHQVIQAAHQHGKWVGLCGEMAGDPVAIPLLLGLGLDEFSMAATAIPSVKALLRKLTLEQAQKIAQQCLRLPNLQRVREFLRSDILSPIS